MHMSSLVLRKILDLLQQFWFCGYSDILLGIGWVSKGRRG